MPIYEQSMNVRKVLYGGTPPGELLSELLHTVIHWPTIEWIYQMRTTVPQT